LLLLIIKAALVLILSVFESSNENVIHSEFVPIVFPLRFFVSVTKFEMLNSRGSDYSSMLVD